MPQISMVGRKDLLKILRRISSITMKETITSTAIMLITAAIFAMVSRIFL